MATEANDVPKTIWDRNCQPEDCVNEPVTATTTGSIPSWLEGVLYRTGPGVGKFGDDTYRHAFDPIAVLHAFECKDGNVKYRSRVLECEAYKKNRAAERIVVSEFGTVAAPDPCQSILGRFAARFLTIPNSKHASDNGAVNVFFQGDQLYATTETNTIVRVDPSTLNAMGGVNHSDYVAVHGNSAHPHTEPDGTVYNMGNSMVRGKTSYNVVKFPPPNAEKSAHEQASILITMPSTKPNASYYHSFAMTDKHILLTEQPMTWNGKRALLSNITRTSVVDFFDWDPTQETLIHVFDKATGEKLPIIYTARAYACFHHINAYEEDGQIVLDLCAADGTLYSKFYFEALKSGKADIPFAEPIRFVLPLSIAEGKTEEDNLVTVKDTACKAFKVGKNKIRIEEEPLNGEKEMMEMPRINYDLNGKKYRFYDTVSIDSRNGNFHCLHKMDAQEKKAVAVGTFSEPGFLYSEPVFVPRPGSTDEDDGVVLSMLHSEAEAAQVSLLVLDGKTFAELARCEVKTCGPVPFSLHGLFNPNQSGKEIFA